jgi:hypothetical protein
MKSSTVAPYASAVLKLLQGPLFSDEQATWSLLLQYGEQIQGYLAQIGLAVQVHEEDGFAYLQQPEIEDDEGHVLALPRLTRRDRLNYQATLLCVLLREQLDQFESSTLEGGACLLTRQQLRALMLPFLHERTNELALNRKIDATISQVVELGFLKRVTNLEDAEYFEVRRILKARVTAERLAEIKEKLQRYATPDART